MIRILSTTSWRYPIGQHCRPGWQTCQTHTDAELVSTSLGEPKPYKSALRKLLLQPDGLVYIVEFYLHDLESGCPAVICVQDCTRLIRFVSILLSTNRSPDTGNERKTIVDNQSSYPAQNPTMFLSMLGIRHYQHCTVVAFAFSIFPDSAILLRCCVHGHQVR